tara:strand:- start:532 stop:924 length:393 start_codon:yes stop_codon:yes gene_type:complete
MKKLLAIIVLGLLFSGSVYADVIRSISDYESLFLRCLDYSKNKKLKHMKFIWFADNKSAWIDYSDTTKMFEYKVRLFQNKNNYLILDNSKKNNVILIDKKNGYLWNEKDEYYIKNEKYLVCSEIKESDLP